MDIVLRRKVQTAAVELVLIGPVDKLAICPTKGAGAGACQRVVGQ